MSCIAVKVSASSRTELFGFLCDLFVRQHRSRRLVRSGTPRAGTAPPPRGVVRCCAWCVQRRSSARVCLRSCRAPWRRPVNTARRPTRRRTSGGGAYIMAPAVRGAAGEPRCTHASTYAGTTTGATTRPTAPAACLAGITTSTIRHIITPPPSPITRERARARVPAPTPHRGPARRCLPARAAKTPP
jgi:hypothetical protein